MATYPFCSTYIQRSMGTSPMFIFSSSDTFTATTHLCYHAASGLLPPHTSITWCQLHFHPFFYTTLCWWLSVCLLKLLNLLPPSQHWLININLISYSSLYQLHQWRMLLKKSILQQWCTLCSGLTNMATHWLLTLYWNGAHGLLNTNNWLLQLWIRRFLIFNSSPIWGWLTISENPAREGSLLASLNFWPTLQRGT